MATTIKLKRKQSLSVWDGVLNEGEPLFDIDANQLYIGDGEHLLSELYPIGSDYARTCSTVMDYIKNVNIFNIFEMEQSGGVHSVSIKPIVKHATMADGINTETYDSADFSGIIPAYFDSDGKVTPCIQYAGGTCVTLNGSEYSGQDVSFYAPTTRALTAGYALVSSMSGLPVWEASKIIRATVEGSPVNSLINYVTVSADVSGVSLSVYGENSTKSSALDNADIKNSSLNNFEGKDIDLIAYDNEIQLLSTGAFTQAALVATGTSDIEDVSIHGNGWDITLDSSVTVNGNSHTLTLDTDIELYSNSIVYSSIYDTLSIDSSTHKLKRSGGAVTYGIDLSNFYITQITLTAPTGDYSNVYTYYSETSNSVTLYAGASNYITVSKSASRPTLIEVQVEGSTFGGATGLISMVISYRLR